MFRRQGECRIPKERRGEGSKREGRKGEFVNTLLPFKFNLDISTSLMCDKVALGAPVSSVCYCENYTFM